MKKQNKDWENNSVDTTGLEFAGTIYSKNLCYINTGLGGGKRREVVVPKWLFYMTWFVWFFSKPHYRKFKGLNVLYEEVVYQEL